MKGFLLKLVASDWKHFNGAVLFLRLFAGGMMLTHGGAKLSSFAVLAERFPDPLGVGSMLSLILILCTEVGCSLLLIFGLMTRLAAIPLIFGMLMAFFFVHPADPFAVKELPLMYTGIYVALLWSGGGIYAVDEIIRRNLVRRVNFG